MDGNPDKATLPEVTTHVGWLIKPIIGALGVNGCAFIIAAAEAPDKHPLEFVTTNV